MVSIVTLAINSIIKLKQSADEKNSAQFVQMQRIYHRFKNLLQGLWILDHEMGSNQKLYGSGAANALNNYFLYRNDEAQFEKENDNEGDFLDAAEKYVDKCSEIQKFFEDNGMPSAPALHPLVRRKVYKMLTDLQQYVFIIDYLKESPAELSDVADKLRSTNLNSDKLKKYIDLIDEWARSYR